MSVSVFLKGYYTRFTSRLRQSTSQVEMDARILQALDRTQKETAHLVLASAPWLPSTPSSKYRYNKADVFVHSSYPSDRKEGKMSPLKKTGAGSDLSSTVRTLPTPPPLRSDKQYLEERAELVARLTLYRAIRRAPWSPSRRKNIDSDFAEEVPDALGDVRAEWNGGGILGDFSAEGSGRNHLTGEYRNEHDERAFRRINTSIDEAYSEASSAETEQNRNFVPFYRQHVGVGSPQQDTYGTEWINKVENAVEVDTDAPTLENIRIEVQDPWDFTEYRSDRSEDSAQQHGFAFRGNDRPNWDDSKMAALEHIGDVSNIPSGKSSAENTRSCQESPLRIAVLPGQQAHYVLRVRVVRGVKSLNSSHRGPDFDISERHRSRGMISGLRSSPAVTERRGILLVKGGVTKGLLLAALSAQFPSALSKIDEDVPPSSSSHIPSAPYPLSELDRTLLSMTISHTPIRSRIRVSDAFDDDREVRSAGENSKNNLYNSGYDSPYGRGLSTCGSPLQSIEHEHDDGMSYPNSNKKNNTNTNSTNIGNSNPHPVPVPFTPQPVVVSLTEQTLDFAPVIDESSELVLSYV